MISIILDTIFIIVGLSILSIIIGVMLYEGIKEIYRKRERYKEFLLFVFIAITVSYTVFRICDIVMTHAFNTGYLGLNP